jgi:hypothetical protein
MRFAVQIHVPAAPDDSGLAVGAAWTVLPPAARRSLAYMGLPLWDAGTVRRGTRPSSRSAGRMQCAASRLRANVVVPSLVFHMQLDAMVSTRGAPQVTAAQLAAEIGRNMLVAIVRGRHG